MPHIIALVSNKGGTGKTTASLHLAAGLARKGHKTLLIDMDSQANLTSATGLKTERFHLGHLLTGEADAREVILTAHPDFHLVPSHRDLVSYELKVAAEPDYAYLLKDALAEVEQDYDYIVIDTAPSLGTLTYNALTACHHYIVPMQGENFAYLGLDEIMQKADRLKARMNPDIRLLGILLSKFDFRTKFGRIVLERLEKTPGLHIFKSPIRQDVMLMECTVLGQHIFDYAPETRGAEDFQALVDEVEALVEG